MNRGDVTKFPLTWPLAYVDAIIKKFSHRSGYDWSGNFKQLSLGDIPSGPADFLMFRLERTSETGPTLTG